MLIPTSSPINLRKAYIRQGFAPEEIDTYLREQANYNYQWIQEKNQYLEENELDLKNEEVQTSVLDLMRGLKFENLFYSANNNLRDIRLV